MVSYIILSSSSLLLSLSCCLEITPWEGPFPPRSPSCRTADSQLMVFSTQHVFSSYPLIISLTRAKRHTIRLKQAYRDLHGRRTTVLCQQAYVRMTSLTHTHTHTLIHARSLAFFFPARLSCNENISCEVPCIRSFEWEITPTTQQ